MAFWKIYQCLYTCDYLFFNNSYSKIVHCLWMQGVFVCEFLCPIWFVCDPPIIHFIISWNHINLCACVLYMVLCSVNQRIKGRGSCHWILSRNFVCCSHKNRKTALNNFCVYPGLCTCETVTALQGFLKWQNSFTDYKNVFLSDCCQRACKKQCTYLLNPLEIFLKSAKVTKYIYIKKIVFKKELI